MRHDTVPHPHASPLDVLPGASAAVVVTVVITGGEASSLLHVIDSAVVLRTPDRSVTGNLLSRLVSHGLPTLQG